MSGPLTLTVLISMVLVSRQEGVMMMMQPVASVLSDKGFRALFADEIWIYRTMLNYARTTEIQGVSVGTHLRLRCHAFSANTSQNKGFCGNMML